MKDLNDKVTIDLFVKTVKKIFKKEVGRPKVHTSAAAKQKAYRTRLKGNGKRVVSKVVLDVRGDAPITSDIIDLSAVKRW